jgi:cytoskeletal protein RodZ
MRFDLAIVGKALKERREELGLSEAEVAKTLNLRVIMVRSLESGELRNLPHEIYIRGYVKEYGRLLGIEGTIAALITPREPLEAGSAVSEPVPPKAEAPKGIAGRHLFSGALSRYARAPKTVLIYAAVILLLVAVFLMREVGQNGSAPANDRSSIHRSAAEVKPTSQPVSHDMAQDKKLMITCHERTWLSIVIDGAEKKVFMLNPEEIVLLTGHDRFDLLVGNAGGIKVFINGKDTGFSGESREVKRITLS